MEIIKNNWQSIKENIRKEFEITDIAYNIWIEPLKYSSYINNVVTILIPNNHTQMVDYIIKKYKKQ